MTKSIDDVSGEKPAKMVEMIPNHERRILEAFVRGVSLSKLDFQDRPLNEYEKADLKRLMMQRMGGFPLQYLIGTQAFYGREFYVNTTVLIPRPETEGLVELALKRLPQPEPHRKRTGLDFGTGSGCIALTLAKERTDFILYGSEASPDASSVAEENGRKFKTHNVEFLRVSETPLLWQYDDLPELDFLISNPPYMVAADPIAEDVKNHEPFEALFVPDGDAMYYYRFLADLMDKKVSREGIGFFEISDQRGAETSRFFQDRGYQVELVKDLGGLDRYLVVMKRP